MTRDEFEQAHRQRMRNVLQKFERRQIAKSDAGSSQYALGGGYGEFNRSRAEKDQQAFRLAETNLDAAIDQLGELLYGQVAPTNA